LKPNTGGGWKDVYKVDSKEELLWAFDQSGALAPGHRPKTMILQEFIRWQDYVRCICIGRKDILPIRYDPTAPFSERYVVARPVEAVLREKVVRDAQKLADALGCGMGTDECEVVGGGHYDVGM